ncbi:MAG: glutamate synthase [Armatimonadota bacterium]|nr:glutamate synthase [Armatimonadota bacterium]
MRDFAQRITDSRRWMTEGWSSAPPRHTDAEGGCGVTGFACSIPVSGRHIYEPSAQMHNRGNGKGGGIAAVGLEPGRLGVSREILNDDYMVHIALLQPEARNQVEADFIMPMFEVHHAEALDHIDDYRDVEGLEVRPPDVQRYFVRVKPEVLRKFAEERNLTGLPERDIEDEFIYQNTFQLNSKYYASLGEKQAFVLSHGRDQMILKVVGYAEHIVTYYNLEDFKGHVWIAHQRYPTRGRVWHPGGAHPFCGLNEALVHNGDFANYYSVSEYLAQRNIKPLFLTDTEVSILVFDLWNRVYRYPLEYIIEGLAPTTERDFDMLPKEKQEIYRRIQRSHIHGSPDGPWFFIIARNDVANDSFQLLGITDTAMLRPQVFALQDGEVQIGLICSEKQAIDATLHSLAKEDSRFCPIADDYWNARGGSYTDGGAFAFNVKRNGDGSRHLTCQDKFGRPREVRPGRRVGGVGSGERETQNSELRTQGFSDGPALFEALKAAAPGEGFVELQGLCSEVAARASDRSDKSDRSDRIDVAIEALTLMIDRRYPVGDNKRSSVLQVVNDCLTGILESIPTITGEPASRYARIDWETRSALRPPGGPEEVLVVNARGFPPEDDDCDARLVVRANELGWKRFICYGYVGQRFLGCGLGPDSDNVVIDAYGSSGDYLASGLDGATVIVHGNAQDQVAQILKRGKLVVHGDVGQTFMYGAKGGSVFIKGNAAGRPLINAVGRPRAVINGTCLDFLAESFMAGDPLNGGGFVVLNGVRTDDDGNMTDLDTSYPGSNLFSLASGGAIYVRDPHQQLEDEQLNGGAFLELSDADWQIILPYLQENERLFDIPISRLLTVDGVVREPRRVYRKVAPAKLKAAIVADDDGNLALCEESNE